MLNGLDLFSGIGGITVALSGWVRPVAYCENDIYAQAVLLSRMREGAIATAPIWSDITTLSGEVLPRGIDLIYGGFPCQDISTAGAGAGLAGKRSGLFFEIIRLVSDLRPRFVFLENVPAIAVRGLDRVLLEFTSLGFDCRWTSVSAAETGATHLRKRWFLLAHAPGEGLPRLECHEDTQPEKPMFTDLVLPTIQKEIIDSNTREGDGLRIPVDRIRCLGNAVVPQTAREAFRRLMGL